MTNHLARLKVIVRATYEAAMLMRDAALGALRAPGYLDVADSRHMRHAPERLADTRARVLVAFGSQRGPAVALADLIATVLVDSGCEAMVSPVGDIYDLTEFDAAIIVGAVDAGRWHHDARRFICSHRAALQEMPVWLVGCVHREDSSAAPNPHAQGLAELATRIGARGHVIFGAAVAAGQPVVTSPRQPTSYADARGCGLDAPNIRCWVDSILPELNSLPGAHSA